MSPMAMRSAADVRDAEERALEAERDTREIRELFEICNARNADIANEGLVARATGAVADRLDHDGVDARTLKLLFDDALRRTENTARTPLPAPAIRAMRALRPGMHAAFQLLQVADDDDDSRPIPILATRTGVGRARGEKARGVARGVPERGVEGGGRRRHGGERRARDGRRAARAPVSARDARV
jgi:hypothetical protein